MEWVRGGHGSFEIVDLAIPRSQSPQIPPLMIVKSCDASHSVLGSLVDELKHSSEHRLLESNIRRYMKSLLRGLHYIHMNGMEVVTADDRIPMCLCPRRKRELIGNSTGNGSLF
ncbi:unnamed protein product [Ilex paraguariensis]|uniref:Protein kinase domain-containing protein n=1 Tax=Ilex paraguariensis TaxID=185542 RepID=A0ABC8SJW3_9AQUA